MVLPLATSLQSSTLVVTVVKVRREVALIETKSDVDRVSSHIESHIQWKEERGGREKGQVVAGFFKGFQEIVCEEEKRGSKTKNC